MKRMTKKKYAHQAPAIFHSIFLELLWYVQLCIKITKHIFWNIHKINPPKKSNKKYFIKKNKKTIKQKNPPQAPAFFHSNFFWCFAVSASLNKNNWEKNIFSIIWLLHANFSSILGQQFLIICSINLCCHLGSKPSCPNRNFVSCYSSITIYPLEMWLRHQVCVHSGPQSQETFNFVISGLIEWKKRPKNFYWYPLRHTQCKSRHCEVDHNYHSNIFIRVSVSRICISK